VRDLVRRLGANRPLVALGESGHLPASLRSDLNVLARPMTRESVIIAVGLALAEGRPARRYPRKPVEPIPATANGITVTIREASVGGVGLEMPGARTNVLPAPRPGVRRPLRRQARLAEQLRRGPLRRHD